MREDLRCVTQLISSGCASDIYFLANTRKTGGRTPRIRLPKGDMVVSLGVVY